jgi:hypothetical protein
MISKEQLTTVPKYDEMLNHRETVSNAQPAHVAVPASISATQQRRRMYMYVPAQGAQKRAPKTGANGGH